MGADSQSSFSCFAHKGSAGDAVPVLSLFLTTNKRQKPDALFRSFETAFLFIQTSFELENLLNFSDDTCSSDPVPLSSSLHEAHSLPESDVSRGLIFLQVFARSTTLYANSSKGTCETRVNSVDSHESFCNSLVSISQ